jgi:molybdopterin-binding protein
MPQNTVAHAQGSFKCFDAKMRLNDALCDTSEKTGKYRERGNIVDRRQLKGIQSYGSRGDLMPQEKLFTPREVARVLGISYPTVKQWIYKKKLRTVKTVGGHHRVPESEIDKLLYKVREKRDVRQKRVDFRRISGRNQLVGRITDIKMSGLLAQVTLSVAGQRITSIVTADAVREMRLKPGQTIAALIKSTEVMLLQV